MSGGFGPTGTVTFQLFGPADPACAGTPIATFPDVALIDGTATSPPVITEVVGTHRWVATYNGDVNNVPVTGSCDDPAEQTTVVAPAVPPDPGTNPPDTGPSGTGFCHFPFPTSCPPPGSRAPSRSGSARSIPPWR